MTTPAPKARPKALSPAFSYRGFAFEAFENEYTPQGSDGKPQGAVTMKWNIKQNKEA